MKTSDLNNQVNQLQANATYVEKTFLDFYNEVKAGNIVPITDQDDNIIGFNTVRQPSTMRVCKIVDGHMTVGDTEEERNQDEVALRTFMQEYEVCPLQQWFEEALVLVKSGVNVTDIVEGDETYVIVADQKKVINLNGDTIVDLSDDSDLERASENLVVKLLRASINSNF